ncbi:adenine phosphoribosyltransferase, partial [Ascochyta clinopodiicola]
RRLSAPGPSASSELAGLKVKLKDALRQFPDFPAPGILFEDILPIFADPSLFEALIHALELHIKQTFTEKPDVIVGLDARGFLFGPTLALRLGAAFVPVRKRGKLPGPCETAEYMKEYGADFFQMQADAVKSGQKVLIVDDIIATGGCRNLDRLSRHANSNRWLRIRSRLARREARRQGPRVHLHPRARFPQGPRQAQRPRLHPALWPGGEVEQLRYPAPPKNHHAIDETTGLHRTAFAGSGYGSGRFPVLIQHITHLRMELVSGHNTPLMSCGIG